MVGFALAMMLLLRPPVAPEAAAYRTAQVFDLGATGFDVAQTWRGLGWRNPLEYEAGDARWFVNPHSRIQVSAFLLAQEALVVLLARRLQRRRGWTRWAAPALLGFEAIAHLRGGLSWLAWRPVNAGGQR